MLGAFRGVRYFNSIVLTHLSQKLGKGPFNIAAATILLVMLVCAAYWGDLFGLGEQLAATPAQVFEKGEYWRLFTALLAHADLGHFLSNSFYLAGLTYLLSGYFGWSAFPLLTFVGGAAVNAIALSTYDPKVTLVGASGMVYFMMAFWLTLYFFIDRRLGVGRRLMNCAAFVLILLIPDTLEPHVSYRAHFIGFVLGLVAGIPYFLIRARGFRRAERKFSDFLRFKRFPSLLV